VQTELEPIPTIDGVAIDLREALANLIINAVDAMPSGGTLTIRTRQANGHVVVEVNDTGIGMPPEIRDRVFEPFFTTKGEAGSGLGLALVHGIVERHGGEIHVASTDGQGTTFTIRLPVGVGVEIPSTDAADSTPQRSLRVLLAEDEPSLRRILASYLQIDGHQGSVTVDGRQALDAFRADAFDLVITDRAMPELNGDQLAAAIKQQAPTIPIIMLTGLGDLMHELDERPAGVDLVISKPVTLAGFREAIVQVTTGT
jgi:CheY-like chemotaxis protein/anti-sigma regulatory factor (Ser/Thr protein kinase)